MNPKLVRLLVVAVGTVLLTSAYHRVNTPSIMTQAAIHFLNSLTPEQRAKTVFKMDDDKRLDWHFIPKERKGLQLREMTPTQKHLAQALLAAGLSQTGYMKAVSIMSLEDILRALEKDAGERRNPEKYHFSVFGEPSDGGTWGYSVEGHHLSQNFTVVKGQVADTPSFFGTNPAHVKEGPRKGLRVLGREEDLARELLNALDGGQKKVAVVAETAYKDILTAASRKASLEGQPSGLPASKMNAKQFEMLAGLVEEYARHMPDQLAEARLSQFKKAGKNLHFAWAGAGEMGAPHYYRVQAPTFLIEYDNTQGGANHVHAVWRDYTNDFGLDLLKAHYQTSHK
ncbi:MAG: DUF3500 domain-containing protein [Bryobacteraceae bacterium]